MKMILLVTIKADWNAPLSRVGQLLFPLSRSQLWWKGMTGDDNDVFMMTTLMQNAERNKSLEGDGSAMRLLVVGSNTCFLVEQYLHHQTQALPSMIFHLWSSVSDLAALQQSHNLWPGILDLEFCFLWLIFSHSLFQFCYPPPIQMTAKRVSCVWESKYILHRIHPNHLHYSNHCVTCKIIWTSERLFCTRRDVRKPKVKFRAPNPLPSDPTKPLTSGALILVI